MLSKLRKRLMQDYLHLHSLGHSHSTKTDVYPLNFVQRVDSCVHMQAGIVRSQSEDIKIAFCGRKPPGDYVLKYVAKGFLERTAVAICTT